MQTNRNKDINGTKRLNSKSVDVSFHFVEKIVVVWKELWEKKTPKSVAVSF